MGPSLLNPIKSHFKRLQIYMIVERQRFDFTHKLFFPNQLIETQILRKGSTVEPFGSTVEPSWTLEFPTVVWRFHGGTIMDPQFPTVVWRFHGGTFMEPRISHGSSKVPRWNLHGPSISHCSSKVPRWNLPRLKRFHGGTFSQIQPMCNFLSTTGKWPTKCCQEVENLCIETRKFL